MFCLFCDFGFIFWLYQMPANTRHKPHSTPPGIRALSSSFRSLSQHRDTETQQHQTLTRLCPPQPKPEPNPRPPALALAPATRHVPLSVRPPATDTPLQLLPPPRLLPRPPPRQSATCLRGSPLSNLAQEPTWKHNAYSTATMNNTKNRWLLDCNVAIALGLDLHENKIRARAWCNAHLGDAFFLCSVSEGALLRILPKKSSHAALQEAWTALRALHALPGVVFLEAPDFSYVNVASEHLQGVKQITDAWLAERARQSNCTLATFDKGLVSQHPDVAYLIP
jgi:predicted nucleic acid-binding protein